MGCFFIREELYNIAGVGIKIISSQLNIFGFLEPFLINDSIDIDMEILTVSCSEIVKPEGNLLIDEDAKWVCTDGIYCNSIYFEGSTDDIICRADANHDWSYAKIFFIKNNYIAELGVRDFLCEILFRNRILFEQGIVIHASAISWEGKGIVFTAPSGTGKSTQAALWADHMGALVLNDDRPALKLENKTTHVYGTPWSGKNNLFNNVCAPLKAIIVLEQASKNSIELLPVSSAVSQIMPRCFLPYYDKEIMAICLSTLGEMLLNIPVYQLKCRPDKESVDLLSRCLEN